MKVDLTRNEIEMLLSALDSAIETAIEEEEGSEDGAKSRSLEKLDRKLRAVLTKLTAQPDQKSGGRSRT